MQYQSPYEGSVAYACSGKQPSGGGVSHRGTLLRGQSIIEYVLIAAVIGLVVIFAGPQVSGAVRNQLSRVTNTVDAGTSGDGFMSAEEKAYREAMKTVVNKEAKDWTLDEQKAAATDIAKNGTSSVVYAKAQTAMDAGTTWSVKLTNGETMTYRIIGINHDDLADGSGNAGLTFWATNGAVGSYRFNSTDSSEGGWERSELRAKMNSGEIWNLMPSDFQSRVKSVKKLTNNVGGGSANKNVAVTATTDRLFLLSNSEIVESPREFWTSNYPWISSEGSQYEAFKGKVTNNYSDNQSISDSIKSGGYRYERTTYPNNPVSFLQISYGGDPSVVWYGEGATYKGKICPAFCF